MLFPERHQIAIPSRSRTFRTPICASPRAAPPDRARPTLTGSGSALVSLWEKAKIAAVSRIKIILIVEIGKL